MEEVVSWFQSSSICLKEAQYLSCFFTCWVRRRLTSICILIIMDFIVRYTYFDPISHADDCWITGLCLGILRM